MKKIILQSYQTTLLSYVLSDEREGKITAIIEGVNGSKNQGHHHISDGLVMPEQQSVHPLDICTDCMACDSRLKYISPSMVKAMYLVRLLLPKKTA